MDPKEFGEFLKGLRAICNLTLTQLSKLSGVSQPYLSNIENGKRGIPSPEILKKLAEPLRISYFDLLHEAGYIDETPLIDDFSLALNISEIIHYLPYLEDKLEFQQIEKQFSLTIGKDFKITEDSLRFLEFEDDSVKYKGIELIRDLRNLIKKLTDTREIPVSDLKELLLNSLPINYSTHKLTKRDIKKIIDILDAIFIKYEEG